MNPNGFLGTYVVRDVASDRFRRPWVRSLANLIPIKPLHEALFAEAFSQALTAGLDYGSSLLAAARTIQSWRFRGAILEMGFYFRGGYTLAESLVRSRVWASRRLVTSLEVGESRGRLIEELSEFARSIDPQISDRLARNLKRSRDVSRFVLALSRLLIDHRLSVNLIADAAIIAAGRGSRFQRVINIVIEDLKSGESFSDTLRHHPKYFDGFLKILIASSSGRNGLRTRARCCGEISSNDA